MDSIKYRKKPVVIDAIKWNGNNIKQIKELIASSSPSERLLKQEGNILIIKTLEGDMIASLNDYIIKGVQGEFYPCKPDIFEQTYEAVD